MSIILFVLSLTIDNESVQPQNIKGLFKWNLIEIGLVLAPPTVNGGILFHGEFLQFNYTLVKSRFGFGISAFDMYSTFDTAHGIILPFQMNYKELPAPRGGEC